MGWTSTNESPTRGQELEWLENEMFWTADEKSRVVAKEKRGPSCCMFAYRVKPNLARAELSQIYLLEPDGSVVIAIVVLTTREGNRFSWKEMSEIEGPYAPLPSPEFRAKLSRLREGEASQFARRWREGRPSV